MPFLFYGPRGLITILLFLSIPAVSRIPLISEEVITLVILMTIILLMIGNLMYKKDKAQAEVSIGSEGEIVPEPQVNFIQSEQ